MSDVMALYPDLYPEHVVGLIRAGEVGGFLPDAALTVSQQAENAWKFKRWHWWTWLVSWNFILTIPGCMLVYQGWMYAFNRAWEDMDQGQNNFMKFIGKGIIWPYGPATLLLILLWYLSRYVIGTRPFNKFRHELVMATPMLAKRTRNENMTIFSWTMGRLAHSGVPPYRAWPLAAESVPNLAMRSRLENAGESMREGVKMSEVVFHSKLFPEEYAPLVATGELTGDMASTLERLSNVSRTEYEVGTTSAKLWNASIGCAAMIVASGLILIVIAKMTADPATKVMDEMTQDQPTHSAP
jgi:general secretion pathway protein F